MRVKLLNIYASPKGTFHPGQVIDLDAHEAQQLIAGRYAEPVGVAAKAATAVAAKSQPESRPAKPPKEKAEKKAPETRDAKPPKEKKVEPPKPAE